MARLARDRTPGIRRLAALISAHGEALEADLAPLGIDLGDLRRRGGFLTWRKLGVLVRHLPPESATMTALRNAMPPELLKRESDDADPGRAPWSHSQMLEASQLDTLRMILHVLVAANGGKPGEPPAPTRRPGVAGQKKRRRLTVEERRRLDPRMRQAQQP